MELDLPTRPRILIVRLSAIGDVICAIPSAAALRRCFPEAHITWVVESSSADVLERVPVLDRVVPLPRKHIRKAWRRPWTVPGAIAHVLTQLTAGRENGFDLVMDFQGNIKSGLITGLSRGRYRVGHDRRFRKEWPNALFTNWKVHPIPEGDPTRNRVDRDLGMLRALGLDAEFQPTPLDLPPSILEPARRFVQDLPGTGPVVVLHPGTSAFGSFKRWDPARFGALGDRLVQECDARVAVSWGPGEDDLRNALVRAMHERVTLFPPPEGLLFLAGVCTESDLVVGADSGPLHLAALMGAPTLTLFGPKDPEIFRPMGEQSRTVWMGVPCSPCRLRRCDHVTCMRTMTVDDVAGPALAMLASVRTT